MGQQYQDQSNHLEWARFYASQGLPVLPCGQDKAPLVPGGYKAATTDVETINDWGARWPEASIGIPTGPASGFLALDIDAPKPGRDTDGHHTLKQLEEKYGPLPPTVEQRTGGGGRHLLFRWNPDTPIRNSTSKVGPGIDVRGEGGYIIVAPSGHPSGGSYEWVPGHAPGEIEPAEAPGWLLERLSQKEVQPAVLASQAPDAAGGTPYGLRALAEELANLEGITEGERNDALNRTAFRLGQLVAGGHLSRSKVETSLFELFTHLGLGPDEIMTTTKSGLEKGLLKPRGPQAVGVPQEWPQPVPFDSFAALPLPVDVLPGWAKDFTQAAAEHMQVAPDLVLANVLGAVATISNGRFKVEVRPGYQEPLNMYILAPAPPAERKTGTQAVCMAPLLHWEHDKLEDMKGPIMEAQSRRKSQEAVISGLRNKLGKSKSEDREGLIKEISDLEEALPQVPKPPRLLADDITPEAMAGVMADNGERLGVASAEGGLFDILAGRYSSGVANLDLVLKAHAGEPVRVDRKHSPPIIMNHPALTMCISPQPEVMAGLMDKPGFRGRGLLGRFIYILPASLLGKRRAEAPSIPGHVKRAYGEALSCLLDLPLAQGEFEEPVAHVIHLDADALTSWSEFFEAVEPALAAGGRLEDIRDWAGKLPGLAARLAGNLHVMDHLEQAASLRISGATMRRALDLAAGLVGHALAAFGMMGADSEIEAAKHALAWIRRDQVESFTSRDCHRALRGRYPRAAQVQGALTVLEERGFIIPKEPPVKGGPGRPASQAYIVNPKGLEV